MSRFRFFISVAFLFSMLILGTLSAFAQEPNNAPAKDSIVFDTDSAKEAPIISSESGEIKEIKSKAKEYVPRRAGLYSAVFPGLGQAYNKKYWKLPIVYGGLVTFGLVIDFWNDRHNRFRNALFTDIIGQELPQATVNLRNGSSIIFDEARLRTLVDQSRRERDFYIILTGVFYLLNVADAHIDAHLKEFELNEDLKVRIEPRLASDPWGHAFAGLSLKLKFY